MSLICSKLLQFKAMVSSNHVNVWSLKMKTAAKMTNNHSFIYKVDLQKATRELPWQ